MIQLFGIDSYEFKRIIEELKGLKADFKFNNSKDIAVRTKTGFININNIDLNKMNVLYLRSAMTYRPIFRNLCSVLNFHGKHIINYRFDFLISDKTSHTMAMALKGIKIIPTIIFTKKGFERINKFSWKFPMVLKHPNKHRGECVIKVNNKEELKSEIDNVKSSIYHLQPFVELKKPKDYRSVYVGKYIGTMIRSTDVEGEFRCNVALGGTSKKLKSKKKEAYFADMTTRIAHTLNLEVFAVDYIKYGKEYAVLEINTAFQFRGFEQATKLNIAKTIAEYLIEKDRSSKIVLKYC